MKTLKVNIDPILSLSLYLSNINDQIEQLLLDGCANDYNFLKQSNKRIEGVDDKEEYNNLVVNI
jgi:myosin heavy subunit